MRDREVVLRRDRKTDASEFAPSTLIQSSRQEFDQLWILRRRCEESDLFEVLRSGSYQRDSSDIDPLDIKIPIKR